MTQDPGLTHVDETGAARMVDVSAKEASSRRAVASGKVLVSAEVVIAITGAKVDLEVTDDAVLIQAQVKTTDRTGVEMEALTAVAVAGLAVIDMVKAIDPAAVLSDVRVELKEGGKTGHWERP